MQTGEIQSVGFFKAAHDVHGVDCLAGCALHQVVDGGDHHEPGAGKFETDVAVIGANEDLGFRKTINTLFFFYNSDKGLLAVNPTVDLPDILFGCTFSDKRWAVMRIPRTISIEVAEKWTGCPSSCSISAICR